MSEIFPSFLKCSKMKPYSLRKTGPALCHELLWDIALHVALLLTVHIELGHQSIHTQHGIYAIPFWRDDEAKIKYPSHHVLAEYLAVLAVLQLSTLLA